MDFDGNGTIEAEELADLIQNDAVTPLILPLLDNDDGDGKVTPEEFRTFFDVWAVMGDQGVETALVTFESLLRVRGGPMQEAYEQRKRELLGIELPVKLPTPRSEEPEPMRDLLKRVRGPALPPRDFVEEAPEPVERELQRLGGRHRLETRRQLGAGAGAAYSRHTAGGFEGRARLGARSVRRDASDAAVVAAAPVSPRRRRVDVHAVQGAK